MPLQSTSGAASYDAFGGGAAAEPVYIEDAFSCFLYSGTNSTQTITNGIDLSGDGGLVWTKMRNTGAFGNSDHWLFDTARGVEKKLSTNTTDAQGATSGALEQFNANGYQLGYSGGGYYELNYTGNTYVSWTLKKQPKFFDVVTWTGNGASNRQISHNLGSKPGFIVYKCTSTTGDWNTIARITDTSYSFGLKLNATNAQYVATNPSSTISTTWFVPEYFNGSISDSNASGQTYVAYVFAHNAGGFGLTGTDNVISCGSFTQPSSGDATITLGYEPQWVLIKRSDATSNWFMYDTMRSMSLTNDAELLANTSAAEGLLGGGYVYPTATGFVSVNGNFSAGNYIYIAIRRGPMKVPTSGTSVFAPITATASTGTSRTVGFPADMTLSTVRTISDQRLMVDRLRGYANTSSATPSALDTTSTAAEAASSATVYNVWNTTALDGPYSNTYSTVWWHFRRAPSFMDVVCYTGTGSATTFSHNLGVVPELMIVKTRTESGRGWAVYAAPLGATKWLRLELTNAEATASTLWNNTAPTSSVFTVGTSAWTNNNTQSFVNYLFATCAGVSKVFSYTGNGSSQTINCGFTGGARFVLIKRTDSTGDWYVWDSARGIVSGNDPHLSLNTTAAEVTSNDTIDTDSTGFVVNQVSATNVNVSSATYIGLAIA